MVSTFAVPRKTRFGSRTGSGSGSVLGGSTNRNCGAQPTSYRNEGNGLSQGWPDGTKSQLFQIIFKTRGPWRFTDSLSPPNSQIKDAVVCRNCPSAKPFPLLINCLHHGAGEDNSR